jgi:hypothetical protein
VIFFGELVKVDEGDGGGRSLEVVVKVRYGGLWWLWRLEEIG